MGDIGSPHTHIAHPLLHFPMGSKEVGVWGDPMSPIFDYFFLLLLHYIILLLFIVLKMSKTLKKKIVKKWGT